MFYTKLVATGPKSISLKEEELPILRWFLWTITLIAGMYLLAVMWGALGNFADILLFVFLAWLLSFILEPWVNHLIALGLNRALAAGAVYLLVGGIVVLSGLIFLPLLADQTSSFIKTLALSQNDPPSWIQKLQSLLGTWGISLDLNSLVRQQIQSFQNLSAATLTATISLAAGVFAILFGAFLVLIFSFYFVLDGEKLWRLTLAHVPHRYHDELVFIKNAISTSFAGFLRTQVLLGILMGATTFVILLIFGVEYAVTSATFAGLAMIMPVIGPLLSIVPPLLVTLVTAPDKTILVFLILFILQALVVNVVGPLLFKRSIGIHPVLVLIAFLVGFKIAGGWGAIFAVPIAGVVLIIASQLLRHWFRPDRSVPELDWPR